MPIPPRGRAIDRDDSALERGASLGRAIEGEGGHRDARAAERGRRLGGGRGVVHPLRSIEPVAKLRTRARRGEEQAKARVRSFVIRKLVDAIVHGFGASAGADLYAEVKKSPESTRADTPDAKRAAALRREAETHERAARKARKALDAAVDAELRAMKKRIARGE